MPTTPIDGEAVIRSIWSTDGPYAPDALAQAMYALAEAIRYANHATIRPGAALPAVDDGATVIRALGQAVAGMPQLLTQLAGWAADLAGRPELSMCDFAGPGPAPDTARQAGEQLLAAATRLAEIDIASAASALGQLYLDTDDAGEPENS